MGGRGAVRSGGLNSCWDREAAPASAISRQQGSESQLRSRCDLVVLVRSVILEGAGDPRD